MVGTARWRAERARWWLVVVVPFSPLMPGLRIGFQGLEEWMRWGWVTVLQRTGWRRWQLGKVCLEAVKPPKDDVPWVRNPLCSCATYGSSAAVLVALCKAVWKRGGEDVVWRGMMLSNDSRYPIHVLSSWDGASLELGDCRSSSFAVGVLCLLGRSCAASPCAYTVSWSWAEGFRLFVLFLLTIPFLDSQGEIFERGGSTISTGQVEWL